MGAMANQGQNDQSDLKNKMESILSMTSKMKEEYQKKKQDEKALESENMSPSLIAQNIFSFSTNAKYQIERMEREWGYEFAKSQN